MILYLLWQILGPTCQRLPVRVCYRAGHWLGWVAYWTWPRIRRNARLNAGYLLGFPQDPQRRDRLARRMVQSYGYYIADFLRLPTIRRNGWESRIVVQGWPELDAAVREGKGVILVGLHQGSWDLGAAALAWRNYPVHVIVEDQPSPWLTRLVRAFREKTGVKVIPSRDGRGMLRALRRGGILCLLIDRPCRNGGVQVDFLGYSAQVPSGAATLALRTGAKVLPGAVVRLPDSRFIVYLGPTIPYRVNGRTPEQAQQLTQNIITRLEWLVSRHAEQWCIYHPFWLQGSPSPGA